MGLLQNTIVILYVMNFLLAGTVIFLERRNVAATWAWLLVLSFLPSVGFILYLIVGQNLSRRKIYKIKTDRLNRIRDILRKQFIMLEQRRIEFKDPAIDSYYDMILMNLVSSHSLYTQDNSVQIFTDGQSKFDSLLEDIRNAREHVHLLYFIVRDDELGKRLMQTLVKKAREGVEVRFLFDHVGSRALPKRFFQELSEAGGHVASFFPSRIPLLNLRLNYRNHRKLAIIDGRYGYIGGFNIGDEYLGKSKRFGPWRDTHLRLEGGAVQQIQVQFILDWNLASTAQLPLELDYFQVSPDGEGSVGMQIVSSGPDSVLEQIKNSYLKMIYAAKESIYLQTPYFIPDDSLLTALKLASISGVDVRVMIPNKPDHKLVYWASSFYLGELLESGVQVYLYNKGFLHAKTIVVDGKLASVGTANIDIRSFRLNFEMNAFIYDTATSTRLKEIFLRDMRSSTELTRESYYKRSLVLKFKESLARLLSPIL
ncbi:cardiolipin synthase [Paenibacillus sp. GCM10012307]|uniref:Cardiolipin synthase n=1 Tax=Paenibacillus roseus TaxID=2798579 RepID=A0A934J8Z5_9BACL|nr:cardiolipin synthase [Paenibacillus roseus]MBJ6362632.1 cardiolipin synthase [Paenibacillus roseus]